MCLVEQPKQEKQKNKPVICFVCCIYWIKKCQN